MEYPFVYVLGVAQYIIDHILATQGVYRNGGNVYNCMCKVEEYCTRENVTPVTKDGLGILISL